MASARTMSSLTLFTNPNPVSPLSGKGILYLHWWNIFPVASWHGATAGSGIRLLLPPCLLCNTGGLTLEKRTWSPRLILSFFNSGSWGMIWLFAFPMGTVNCDPPIITIRATFPLNYSVSQSPTSVTLCCVFFSKWFYPLISLNDIRLFFVTSARDVFLHCSMISSKPEDTICLSFTNNWFHHSKCCQCSALAFQCPFLYSSCLHSPERSLSTVDDWLWAEIWDPTPAP